MKLITALLLVLPLAIGTAFAAAPPWPPKAPPKQKPVTMSAWSVSTTYPDEGDPVCVLRFRNFKDDPSLSLEERPFKKLQGGATFTLGGLPPLLAGKKGVVRDIQIAVGKSAITDVKGSWSQGSSDKNSRLTMAIDVPLAKILPIFKQGNTLTVSFELATSHFEFPFTLEGAAAPVARLADCR